MESNTATKLTKREIEIIKLVKKGYSRKMIAEELGISETTVDTHLRNIHHKTNTHNSAGVAMIDVV